MTEFDGSYVFSIDFHDYQIDAIQTMLKKQHKGQTRFHLVAPPGSGKTLMGLELIREFKSKAVILSPTVTIQNQWISKFKAFFSDTSGLDHLLSHEMISKDIEDHPQILSLTYQYFSVKSKDKTHFLHENVQKRYQDLIQNGYDLLVLDECHHLLAHWGKAIQYYLDLSPKTLVLGLTATPPVDRKSQELSQYLSLVTEVDYEIPLPAVVKEGHLSPFQDLVYLVKPNQIETQFITDAHRCLHQVLARLESPPPDSDLPSLAFWAEGWLLNPIQFNGIAIDSSELLMEMPDQLIALSRYLYHLGLYPQGVPWLPEIEVPFQLLDLVRLISLYANLVLAPIADPLWNDVLEALSVLGYRHTRGQFVKVRGAVDKVLSLSVAKLRGMHQILQSEIDTMDSALRVLILTDFETTHAPGGKAAAEGILDPEAGGALAAMRYVTSHPDLDVLDPLMVTGKTLLCDDDFLPVFESFISQYIEEKKLDLSHTSELISGFYQIKGTGKDWSSATYLAVVTELLELGLSRCLIGTRGLLAEGWDCQALNTLIDLTAVTSYVSVNQIRGRTLRKDPRSALKIANNWDIVALIPELEGGLSDIERFYKKHRHFYGLSDDGCIEKGVGHVHAIFDDLAPEALLVHMDGLNQNMLERASNRVSVYEQWGVGQPYQNKTFPGIQLHLKPFSTQSRSPLLAEHTPLAISEYNHALDIKLKDFSRGTLVFRALGLLVFSGGFLLPLSPLVYCALALTIILGLDRVQLAHRRKKMSQTVAALEQAVPRTLFDSVGRAILLTLQKSDSISDQISVSQIQVLRRDKTILRVVLNTDDTSASQLFTQAFKEFFEPIQEHRYILQLQVPLETSLASGWMGKLTLNPNQPVIGHFPVPRVFGISRKLADIFLFEIESHLGEATLFYTKRGVGKEKIKTLMLNQSLGNHSKKVDLWH